MIKVMIFHVDAKECTSSVTSSSDRHRTARKVANSDDDTDNEYYYDDENDNEERENQVSTEAVKKRMFPKCLRKGMTK